MSWIHRDGSRLKAWTGRVIAGPAVRDTWCEYLRTSGYIDNAAADALRVDVVDRLRTMPNPRAAIDQAMSDVQSRIQYASGTTSVSTTAHEAWERRTGVCQDFTRDDFAVASRWGFRRAM